jgi:hypothetical protein
MRRSVKEAAGAGKRFAARHDLATTKMAASGSTARYWSKHVMETSDALDLEPGVFRLHDPKAIAASLKRSALASTRRKAEPFRSAMSMLVFYINRAGKNLSKEERAVLERAKDELRLAFGREPKGRRTR